MEYHVIAPQHLIRKFEMRMATLPLPSYKLQHTGCMHIAMCCSHGPKLKAQYQQHHC